MDSQNPMPLIHTSLSSIFTLLDSPHSQTLESPLAVHKSQLLWKFEPNKTLTVIMGITDTYLLLRDFYNRDWQCPLDSSLKVQFLHSQSGNFKSRIVGFKLFKKGHPQPLEFIGEKGSMEEWSSLLRGSLNIIGFYHYFKGVKKEGKGCFAAVYKVRNIRDSKIYAAKGFQKNKKQSFVQQIQILRTMSHQNILQLYGVYESPNSVYIVTEFLGGKTLSQRESQVKNKEEIQLIIHGLLLAIQSYSLRGISHRDIKEQNVMFRDIEGLSPVLIDFGLGVIKTDDNRNDSFCGTPGYLPPEIFLINDNQSVELCEKRDIFAVGAIFHKLLLKQPLYKGKSHQQTIVNNFKNIVELDESRCNDQNALDLLKRMISGDQSKRISVTEALRHSYFSSLHYIAKSSPNSVKTE